MGEHKETGAPGGDAGTKGRRAWSQGHELGSRPTEGRAGGVWTPMAEENWWVEPPPSAGLWELGMAGLASGITVQSQHWTRTHGPL